MNKIFKVIWHHATQSWVVTSELSKAHGKTASTATAGEAGLQINGIYKAGFVYTAIASAILMVSGQAFATNNITGEGYQQGTDKNCFYNPSSESVICGDASTKTSINATSGNPARSVVIGKGATNTGESNVAMGLTATTGGTASVAIGNATKATFDQSVSIGQNAEASGRWDVSIGRFAGQGAKAPAPTPSKTNPNPKPEEAEGRNIAIGDAALKNGLDVNNNIAMGTSAGQNMKGARNVVLGTYANTTEAISRAESNGSTAKEINYKTRNIGGTDVNYIDVENSVAIGHRALSTKIGATAVGQQAQGFGTTSTAVGNSSRALGDNSVAMGNTANAGAGGAIAIGLQANYQPAVKGNGTDQDPEIKAAYKKTGASSVTIGVRANASENHAIAMGTESKALAQGAVAVGSESKTEGVNATAIGQASEAKGQNSFAAGNDSHALGKSAVAVGDGAGKGDPIYEDPNALVKKIIGFTGASGNSSTAVGAYSKSKGEGGTAVGVSADAQDYRTVAVGAFSTAVSRSAIAVGDEAYAQVEDSIAIGRNVRTEYLPADLALKNEGRGDREGMIAIGSETTKASGKAAISIGRNAQGIGRGTVALGDASKALEGQGVAVGAQANVIKGAAGGIAIGSLAKSEKHVAIAIGSESLAKGDKSVSVGSKSSVDSEKGIAVGYGAKALGAETANIAIGDSAYTNASGAVVIGKNTSAKGLDGVTTPNGNKASPYNAIAIGTGANVDTILSADPTKQERSTDAIAIGTGARAQYASTIAIGFGATANTKSSATAIGLNSDAQGWKSLALGVEAVASQTDSVALGSNSVANIGFNKVGVDPLNAKEIGSADSAVWKSTKAAVSVGNVAADITRQITSVAAGTQDTDAVNVAQLKAAGFKLAASHSIGGEHTTVADDKIQNGETVTIDAGRNIKVDHTANKVSISVNNQGVVESAQLPVVYTTASGDKVTKQPDGKFYLVNPLNGLPTKTEIKPENVIASMQHADGTTTAPTLLTNLASTLPDTTKTNLNTPVIAQSAPSLLNKQLNNAATVADVLNAGFNLQTNDRPTDFVRAYDTLNFKNGVNTKVRSTTDNTTTNIFVDVVGLPIQYTTADGRPVAKVGDEYYALDDNGVPCFKCTKPEDFVASVINPKDSGPKKAGSATKLANVQGNLLQVTADGQVNNPNGTKAKDPSAENLKAGPQTADEIKALRDTPKSANYAATLGDVLNSGWNLQGNGAAKDFVRHADTVNFVDGTGTTVEVETTADGTTSTVKVNTLVELVDAEGNPVKKAKDGKFYKPADIGADGNPTAGAKAVENPQVNLVNPTATAGNETKSPIQLGNLAAGTNTLDGTSTLEGKPLVKVGDDYYKAEDIDQNGKPIAGKKPIGAVWQDADSPFNGLADLATSNPNNAATVADLRKMGWVVSTEDGYKDDVRNANEVKFVGDKKFITVEGLTNKETGLREVKISLKEGDIINKDEGTATIDGQPTEVVKAADGKYYKKSDIDPTTGLPFVDPNTNQPRADIKPLTDEQVATIKNNGNGLVTGHKVAEALQKSGWTVGKAEAEEAFEVTYTNADEKVNPNDNVRFADGKNTVASLGTVKKLDADGKVVTTTVVKVDVDLPVDFKYTDATGKEYVKANDGKFYAKDQVGTDGKPNGTATPLTATDVAKLKKGAQLTDGVNANGQPNNAYTAQDPIQVAVEKAAKDAVAKTLQDNPQATPEQIAAAVKTATDKARVEAIKANPEAKDVITAGTGGVNLDNVAWAEKPDQAVNKDQLDQTVNKSGFFVQQNGESTNGKGKPTEKVTPNDVVDFTNGANTVVTAETTRDEKTGVDTTKVSVHVNGLPLTYTTKDASGKDVPVAKVGDKFYQVGADGKPDMTKPADVNALSTNLVNPAAPNGEIGAPSQLGNVANGANTFVAPQVDGKDIKLANDGKWYAADQVDPNGSAKANAKAIDAAKAKDALGKAGNGGLADFANSNPNNAATVGDLQNLGFNIGASENGYTDQVRNNAKVDFVGDKKFINVEGATKADGTREIKISLKEGDVIKPNEGVATIDGQPTDVVKVGNDYYKKSDIDPTTGKPNAGAQPLTQAQKDTVVNNGDGLVTGHKVAEALQKSGWTVGKADAAEAANVDYNNKSEKVNPDDKVSFADGKNTQVSLGTVKQEDKDGKVVTTTTVKVDVDLPIDFKYTDATGKEFVKANDGKIYAKDQVGADGKPNGNATPLADAEVAKLNKGAQLTNGLGKETPKYEVKDPIAAAAEKAVADTLAANPQATPADILKAVDAAKAAAIKANPNAKDEITKGTGGVNLDNVAWAEKPDQAVNKDQLDQTVNKSGFFVQQNGESTNGKGKPTEKVTPNDVVDFTNGANTVVTAETTRDEKTGVDTTKVSVHVNGLPLTYTTKDASGKDVPVAKVGDKFYQVGADGKPDMTKPADVNSLSTNLVNPAAPNGEIGAPSQLGNVANGANTFVAPQVDGKDIKLANDGKWYAADQVDPNGSAKANAKAIDAAKAKDALGKAGNGGLADFANSNPNNAATVGDLQNLGFVIGTADDKYKDQVRNNSRVEFASGNKNATVTGSTLADGTRQVKVTISDNPVFNTIQVGGDKGPKVGSTATGDVKVSKADGSAARITNVAPGVNGTDAVNVNQLKQGLGDINNRITKTDKNLRGGIAGSNAAAGLPQVYLPGKSMVAAAAGTYKGESAVAVGYSRASDNGKVILKLQGNANTRGDFGGSVGVGYQW
ncbi:YadA-like family protein [Frederiksenia canicola]